MPGSVIQTCNTVNVTARDLQKPYWHDTMRLLLIEDDPVILDVLKRALGQAGYTVDCVSDGEQADAALAAATFDVAVLDLGLPRLDGLAVLRRLRQRQDRLPVMILSARDTVQDKIDGLDCGADDFMSKPFDLKELEARLRALLRRGQADVIGCGRLRWHVQERRAYVGDVALALSSRETALLELMLLNLGRVVGKDRILDMLTGWDGDIGQNAIEVYVHRLRRKLDGAGAAIRTVRGLGYLLEAGDAD